MTSSLLIKKRSAAWLLVFICSIALVACVDYRPFLLRKNADSLRDHFFAQTPVGTSFDEVLKKLRADGYAPIPNMASGFVRQEAGEEALIVGQSSIKATLGDYWSIFLLTTSVTAYWGFDSTGHLVDIWIWKTTDGT
jgi:hypothetical protein